MESLERGLDAVAEDTQEPYTDYCITALVHTGALPSAQEALDALYPEHAIDEQQTQHYERLRAVAPLVEALTSRIKADVRLSEHEIERYMLVLELVLKLHIDDADRADGTGPFLSHTLRVALRVFELYEKQPDVLFVVNAALLHDAVEDQSRLLNLEERLAKKWKTGVSKEEIEREGATEALGHFVGMRSRILVEGVTTPLHDKKILPAEEKNHIYQSWAEDIVTDSDNPARFIIKWADWEQNAFPLNKILEEALRKEKEGDHESANKKRALYAKLRRKYEPVLRTVVLPFLKNDMKQEHPLWEKRDEMIAQLEEILRTQYA